MKELNPQNLTMEDVADVVSSCTKTIKLKVSYELTCEVDFNVDRGDPATGIEKTYPVNFLIVKRIEDMPEVSNLDELGMQIAELEDNQIHNILEEGYENADKHI